MRLIIQECAALPPLCWAAIIVRGGRSVEIRCGSAVELDEDGLIAGAWSGPFDDRAVHRQPTFAGTAVRQEKGGVVFVCGNASPTGLHVLRSADRLVVSNSFALALAAGGSTLSQTYPFYPHDLYLAVPGRIRHQLPVPTTDGEMTLVYQSLQIGPELELRRLPAAEVAPFADYRGYRTLLEEQIGAVFANAADPRRRVRYTPLASISKGYDSPAAAVLARDLGCREAVTFRQSIHLHDDSGEAIAQQLGLTVHSFDTFAYKERTDLPEPEFIAASFSGGQVYLAGTESLLRERIVVTGFGGDVVWSPRYGSDGKPRFPIYLGGYSSMDFCFRLPAIELAVPAIGAVRAAELGALSRAPEMAPWSNGGDYDRPLPRRIVEEAGIARGSFAEEKRMITPPHDSVSRRAPPVESYLSPHSLAEFEEWYERRRPLSRLDAAAHRVATDTVGRVLWSKKSAAALRRVGLSWPPHPAKLVHLRIHKRRNAFLFQWAMERQLLLYRRALAAQMGNGFKLT